MRISVHHISVEHNKKTKITPSILTSIHLAKLFEGPQAKHSMPLLETQSHKMLGVSVSYIAQQGGNKIPWFRPVKLQ